MKKSEVHPIRSKMFRNFLLSYVSVFFVTLNILAIMVVVHIVRNLYSEEIRVTESKLYTIAEDLEMQMEAMRETALEIASRQEFQPAYFKSHKYREIEMLEQLESYKQNQKVSDVFFVKYKDSDTIFSSSGRTMRLKTYIQNEFGEEYYREIEDLLEQLCLESQEVMVIYKQADRMLFLFPLKRYALGGNDTEGVLCFQVRERDLEKRMEKIAGILHGEVYISYLDFGILGEASPEGEASGEEEVLELTSLAGNFDICFQLRKDEYFSWSNVFSAGEAAAFAGISVLLLGVGFFVAYWNFKPMRKITEKYRPRLENGLEEDWESIDATLGALLYEREKYGRQWFERYQFLREHTISVIAAGGYSEKVKEYMALLDIKLEGSVYGLLRCSFDEEPEGGMHQGELYRDVEDLSGNGIALYPFRNRKGDLNVLAVVEEEYQIEEAIELLQSLMETKELSVQVEVTGLWDTIKEIGRKASGGEKGYGRILSKELETGLDKDSEKCGDEEWRNNQEKADKGQMSMARQAVEYIKANCTCYDLSLDLVAEKFGVTSVYLCRAIKREVGMNYKEYLTELRIAEAKRMLLDPNVTVAQICQMSGYGNVSHFIKVFQQYTGMTPAKYRDEHKEVLE